MLVFTTTPPGYRPDRYTAWCRWMRIYRKTNVSRFPAPYTGKTVPQKFNRAA